MIRTVMRILVVALILALAAGMCWWWYRFRAAQGQTYTVGTGEVLVGVTVSGTVESRQKTAVAAEVVAAVRSLDAKEGQRVSRGDVLVRLDDGVIAADCAKAGAGLDHARHYLAELKAGARKEEIVKAREAVKQAESRLKYARKEHQNLAELAKHGGAGRSELDLAQTRLEVAGAEVNAAQAQLRLLQAGARPEQIARAEAEVRLAEAEVRRSEALRRKYTLRTPHDGIVTARYVHVGEVVSPGQVLLRLDNIEDLRIRAHVQETQLSGVQPGSRAMVVSDAYSDRFFPAVVENILPRVDPQSGTVSVLLKLTAPPDVVLMDGMAVDVALIGQQRRDVVRVPARAIEKRGGQASVWLRKGSSFRPQIIQTGLSDAQWVEVLVGLKPGDVIQVR